MANTGGMRDKGTVGHVEGEMPQGEERPPFTGEQAAQAGARLLHMALIMETAGHVAIRATSADLPMIVALGELLQADMVEIGGGFAVFIRI